jgi:hypothetical protein
MSVVERVLSRVDHTPGPFTGTERGDCWIFSGALSHNGYGQIGVGRLGGTKRAKRRTHRVMYEHEVGPIPVGYQIDHLCRVRACCNPAHLEAVPQAENIRRQWAATSV